MKVMVDCSHVTKDRAVAAVAELVGGLGPEHVVTPLTCPGEGIGQLREALASHTSPGRLVVHPVDAGGDPARGRAAAVAAAAASGHEVVVLLAPHRSEVLRIRDRKSVMVLDGADLVRPVTSVLRTPEPSGDRAPKTLAVVSPWPPTKSGVADYAAMTLDALAHHYAVTVVSEDPVAAWPTISPRDFADSWWQYDRVLYHLGNSLHHSADLELLADAPGAAIVHDAVLDGAIHGARGALGHPGGASALLARDGPAPPPGELELRGVRTALAPALGILVHSQHAAELLRRSGVTHNVLTVARLAAPQGETPPSTVDASGSTAVLAHFGFVNEFKGADVLVEAAAELIARGVPCEVAFVGDFASATHRSRISRLARRLDVPTTMTGFVSAAEWQGWLGRAACAVQLREQSHGESSAALGELFAAGLPVLCTDIGSFAELPEGVVRHVPPGVTPGALADALLDVLEPASNQSLRAAARTFARADCSPSAWAASVSDLLEASYKRSFALRYAEESGGAHPPAGTDDAFELRSAAATGRAVCVSDVSVYANTPFFSGIQRMTSRLHDVLGREQRDITLAPARITEGLDGDPHPGIARDPLSWLPSYPLRSADWLLCADLNVRLSRHLADLRSARRTGLRIATVIYDIIPVTNPEWFPRERGDVTFKRWLDTMLEVSDLLVAISGATASAVETYVQASPPSRVDLLRLATVPCGWDLGMPQLERTVRGRDPDHFLMVGTIEPRKGHAQVLEAFEQMWRAGSTARLTVVGRRGWLVDDLCKRMTVLDRTEPRFRWLEGADDRELASLYDRCTAVLMASLAEGFGLPVVEAALRGCPVILRDIPVLREVAGDAAVYFEGDGSDIQKTITSAIDRAALGDLPTLADGMPTRRWEDVGRDVIDLLADRTEAGAVWSPVDRAWRRP